MCKFKLRIFPLLTENLVFGRIYTSQSKSIFYVRKPVHQSAFSEICVPLPAYLFEERESNERKREKKD